MADEKEAQRIEVERVKKFQAQVKVDRERELARRKARAELEKSQPSIIRHAPATK